MPDIALAEGQPASLVSLRARSEATLRSPKYLIVRRCVLASSLVLLAYHYSLSTLLRTLKSETPLAYLGLVPVVSVLLGLMCIRPLPSEPSIHDRQVDFIIGVPLIAASLAFEIIMPVRMSTLFWLDRLDLVSLPFFVAGTIALVFGVRTLWRLKLAVLFLILAWPLPYSTLLVNWLTAFTSSTLAGLNVFLHLARVATSDPAQGVGTYIVHHGPQSFPVSVASACSGVNGMVGYLLVAAAFTSVIVGSALRKGLWLAGGLATVWIANVTRIFVILSVGHWFGEKLAIDVLHPMIGLVTFNVVVLAMVLTLPRFGLRLHASRVSNPGELQAQLLRAVPRARSAICVLLAAAALGYFANSTLRQYDLVLTDLGAPRLTAFSDQPGHPTGWSVTKTNTYTWAKPFFGNDSTWFRYAFTWNGLGSSLSADQPVISDVINTSDVTTFSTYGIEACYRFHGYKLYSIRTVDLGAGVTGNVLAYYNPATKSDWTTLYWHWPVRTAGGKIRYERVTLMLVNASNASLTGPPPSPSLVRALGLSVQNALAGKPTVRTKFDRTRTFLVEFARQIIVAQAAQAKSAPTTTGSSVSPPGQ